MNKNSPEVILDQYSQALNKESPAHPDSIPDEFLFRSKVVVLSKETEIPSYLGDDILAFQINYDRAEALEMIDKNLDSIGSEYPMLTLEMKKEILAFIRHTGQSAHQKISLRTFLHVALIWCTRSPNRESWILAQLPPSS